MLNTSRFSIRYRFVRIRYIYTYFFDTAPWSITTIPPITNCNSQSLQTKLKASPISTQPYSYSPIDSFFTPHVRTPVKSVVMSYRVESTARTSGHGGLEQRRH